MINKIKDGIDWVMYYGEKYPFYRFCASMAAFLLVIIGFVSFC